MCTVSDAEKEIKNIYKHCLENKDSANILEIFKDKSYSVWVEYPALAEEWFEKIKNKIGA